MARQVIGYNVYEAKDGCDLVFFGFAKTKTDARRLPEKNVGIEKSMWGTAKAAGHCAGTRAPEGEEADEPSEWFDGDYCLVPVYAS